ncbi:PREDICTED: uncharacterized protein LOC104805572 [Tarenaya hassleriana]|uniref:uncharacterized protein LOC104805572 n=1 Tax=Tarenaya hassleriana TaxID=28532 RepID=UPI00053C3C02|nr:PREDICTED: uncharacterized protein LOC104805572 [Tarenaya hassleriana]
MTNDDHLHHPEEKIPLRSNSTCLDNPSPEFDFRFRQNSKQRFSHADELFSDGKILPLALGFTSNVSANPGKNTLKTQIDSGEKCLRQHSDAENLNSGCGFWLTRSKSVGYCLRKKKGESLTFLSDYGNADAKKKKKSLQKMSSTEKASTMLSNYSLTVPLADIFCFGSGFSGPKGRRK